MAKEHTGRDSKQFNDLVSGLQNASSALGQLIGPLVGNYLNTKFSFFTASDVMAFWGIFYVITHWLVCDLWYSKKAPLKKSGKRA